MFSNLIISLLLFKISSNNKLLSSLNWCNSSTSLLTSKETIVVASVAAIYGANKPEEYKNSFLNISVGQNIKRNDFFVMLVQQQYQRNQISIESGEFSVKGDVVEIAPGWTHHYNVRIEFFDDTIESIKKIDPLTKKIISKEDLQTWWYTEGTVMQYKRLFSEAWRKWICWWYRLWFTTFHRKIDL